MSKAEICPGILTHAYEEYIAHLEMIENSGATWAHIDVMDGQFVPNITVMPHEFMSISTRLKLEAHLMAYRPERYYSDLTVAGVNRVLIHREAYESMEECAEALKQASDYFGEVGMVINPNTVLEDYSGLPIQVIQCMGVAPGASGQSMIGTTCDTIQKVAAQRLNIVIAVDGGVREDNIVELQEAGAERFVITSQLYIANNVNQNLQHFNQLLAGGLA